MNKNDNMENNHEVAIRNRFLSKCNTYNVGVTPTHRPHSHYVFTFKQHFSI